MKIKRLLCRLSVVPLIAMIVLSMCAFTPFESYTYSTATDEPEYVYSPAPFNVDGYIDAVTSGAKWGRPSDFAFDKDGMMYIIDSQLNKLIILDQNGKVNREIAGFVNNGKNDTFNGPKGFYLSNDNLIYICDTKNSRIVVLKNDGSFVREIGCPRSPLLDKNYEFKPSKIAVDDAGTMYVVNSDEYYGLMKITSNGHFVGFIGSNKAVVNPILKLWKSIYSEKQQSQIVSFVPVEYQNISMDSDGFLYAVSASTAESTPVKRLNLSGTDILIRSGYVDVAGDVLNTDKDSSIFVDVCSADNGNYFVLDMKQCRVFTYNQEGYLLYAFGGKGTQLGTFSNPSAIEYHNNKLYVLDEIAATVTIFSKTDYAEKITKAENCYYEGRYEESEKLWNEVLKINAFFELGYLQLGKIALNDNRIDDAMRYFELGNYRGDTITYMTGYNKAFTEFRKEFMAEYLGYIIIAFVVLVIATTLINKHRKNKKEKGK